ncbi:MAG: protoporphyrinogen oxidase HemJ [Microscillaceae bacterium]
MALLYIKSVHIIFVVSWFAGLFYIVRLFIYHTEAEDRPEAERRILQTQFILMEKKLWNIITTPAMVLTVLSGLTMLWVQPAYLGQTWMWVKLGMVGGVLLYHFYCQKIVVELRNGRFRFNSFQLRMWNEVATLFLVAIVFIVELQNALNWIWGVLGLLAFALVLMVAIRLYRKAREKKLA